MTEDKQLVRDMADLMERAAFRRFLFAVIQRAGIFSAQTDGSVGRDQFNLGRRNLGLEILDLVETGQPVAEVHPGGALLTLIQVLREETTRSPTETQNAIKAKSSKHDRHAELLDDDGDDPDAE
jgi:hypothetical protein